MRKHVLLGMVLGGLLLVLPSASAEQESVAFDLSGRHDTRGRFVSTIQLIQQSGGKVTVTRTVRFGKQPAELQAGTGSWTKNTLQVELQPIRSGIVSGLLFTSPAAASAAATQLQLVVDRESGFCVVRTTGLEGGSSAQGRIQGDARALVRPSPQDPSDLVGWRIPIAGTVHHAARRGERVYVAAGSAGLTVVDLEQERVAHTISLPGHARHVVVVSNQLALVTAQVRGVTQIHRVDLQERKLLLSSTCPRAASIISTPVGPAVLGEGPVRFLDTKRAAIGTTRTGSSAPGVDQRGARLYLPLGRGGGLALLDLQQGKVLEVLAVRDWLHDVKVVGRRAFVAGSFKGLGVIDLETREVSWLGQRGVSHLVVRDGRVYTLTAEAVLTWSSAGKLLNRTPLGTSIPHVHGEGWIVDVRDGTAILALRGVGLVILEL